MSVLAHTLIPHRPPMLFIDSVHTDEDGPFARSTVCPGWILLNKYGELSGEAFFEVLAQGFACISAWSALQSGTQPGGGAKIGLLVGVKRFRCFAPARAGDVLCIRGADLSSLGPFHIFEASASNDRGQVLASGQIKVFLPGKDFPLDYAEATPL